MKTPATNSTAIPTPWTNFLGAIVAGALMMPAVSISQSPTPVNLRSTANFAVLAASLVSNIPTSAVTGDIGLSPATGSNITGFGPAEVTGTIYTVDATGPAGSVPAAARLTTAKRDLTTAYNDAMGRTPVPTGSFLNPGSGNIGGLTLVPGLYKFTSAASIMGSDVTLTGSATDVWIFQITSALTVGSGIKVILSGGAQSSNIFWQVGTSATLGTTSIFKGTIMANQSITLAAGASLEGRALARIAAVTLSSNVITRPTMVSGTVVGTVRAASATGAPVASALVVIRRGSATGTFVDSIRTNGSGVYTFSGVASGLPNYWITVSATGFGSATTTSTSGVAIVTGATTTANFSLLPSANIVGTVRAGSATGTPVDNTLVVLRRSSATGVVVDSTRTNSNGAYVFLNEAPGTPNYWITATAAAGTGTNANVVVGTGTTVTSNIVLIPASLYQVASNSRGIRFSRTGNQLALDLGVSNEDRTLTVYSLNGNLRNRTSVPAGSTRAVLPATFSPENGYLFQLK